MHPSAVSEFITVLVFVTSLEMSRGRLGDVVPPILDSEAENVTATFGSDVTITCPALRPTLNFGAPCHDLLDRLGRPKARGSTAYCKEKSLQGAYEFGSYAYVSRSNIGLDDFVVTNGAFNKRVWYRGTNLTILGVTQADSGSYACAVYYTDSMKAGKVLLTVLPPENIKTTQKINIADTAVTSRPVRADHVTYLTALVGDTVTLTCNGEPDKLDAGKPCNSILASRTLLVRGGSVAYCKENSTTDWVSGTYVYQTNIRKTVMRGDFKRRTLYQHGNVTIVNVTQSDAGRYACAVYSPDASYFLAGKIQLVVLTLADPVTKAKTSKASVNVAAVAAGSVAGVIIIIVITIVIIITSVTPSRVQADRVTETENPAYDSPRWSLSSLDSLYATLDDRHLQSAVTIVTDLPDDACSQL